MTPPSASSSLRTSEHSRAPNSKHRSVANGGKAEKQASLEPTSTRGITAQAKHPVGARRARTASRKSSLEEADDTDTSEGDSSPTEDTPSRSTLSAIEEDLAPFRGAVYSGRTRSSRSRSDRPFSVRRHVKRRQTNSVRLPASNINPSLLSVLSSLTALTHTSGSSGSTLTQKSFNRDMAKGRHRAANGSHGDEADTRPPNHKSRYRTPSVEDADGDLSPEYTKETQQVATSSSAEDDSSVLPTTPTSNIGQQVSEDAEHFRGPVRHFPNEHRAESAYYHYPNTYTTHDAHDGRPIDARPAIYPHSPQWGADESGEYAEHANWQRPIHSAAHPAAHPSPPGTAHRPNMSKPTPTGYEQMAVELCRPEGEVKPLYRRFSHLNHRILLHLQDQMAELEDRLRDLDELIAQETPLAAKEADEQTDGEAPRARRLPSSRRAESYQPTQLQWERQQLLGWIYHRADQYNRALSSFAKASRSLPQAEPSTVEAYKAFVNREHPVAPEETKFLDQADDLITLPHHSSETTSVKDAQGSVATKSDHPSPSEGIWTYLVLLILETACCCGIMALDGWTPMTSMWFKVLVVACAIWTCIAVEVQVGWMTVYRKIVPATHTDISPEEADIDGHNMAEGEPKADHTSSTGVAQSTAATRSDSPSPTGDHPSLIVPFALGFVGARIGASSFGRTTKLLLLFALSLVLIVGNSVVCRKTSKGKPRHRAGTDSSAEKADVGHRNAMEGEGGKEGKEEGKEEETEPKNISRQVSRQISQRKAAHIAPNITTDC